LQLMILHTAADLGSKELVFSLTEILLEVDIIGFLMRGLRGMVGMECFLIGTFTPVDVLIGLVILEGLLVLVTLLLVLPALLLVGCLAFVLPESGGGSG